LLFGHIPGSISVLVRAAKIVGAVVVVVVLVAGFNYARYLVYWGPTESVSYVSGGVSIACTLALPQRPGPFPAILELLGSGPEVRSDPAYRINATNMVRRGFAVLVCDKRGVGESGGNLEKATFADFAADAAAGVHYLAGRSDIDPDRIGLLTNSESGWYSPQVAADTGQVAFIINRVGSPLPWLDTVLWETRNDLLAAGVTGRDLDDVLAATARRWRFYIEVNRDPQLSDGPERDAIDAELARLRRDVPAATDFLPQEAMDYDPEAYAEFAADAAYDPGAYLRQIDIPLLYVLGGKDINVPTKNVVAFLENFRDTYQGTVDLRVYPDLGHALATWRGIFHGGYTPDYLSFVGQWAESQIRSPTRP
jgi:fermentation-respiration switch protein FrsA (DUF1100 family)